MLNLILWAVDALKKQKIIFAMASAALGIAAMSPRNFYFLGFVFLIPFFYFLHEENSFWKLLTGAFIFRFILGLGTVYYTFEPLTWSTSACIFLGLPVAIFILKRRVKLGFDARLAYIPLLYLAFDLLQARYSYIPEYIMTAGNIFGSSPFVGLAKYGGILSLEFFTVSTNAFLLVIFLNFKFLIKNKKKLSFVLIGLATFLVVANLLSSYSLRQNSEVLASHNDHLSVTSVALKKDFTTDDLNKLISDLGNIQTDLLVLPEELFVKPGNESFSLKETSVIVKNFNAKATNIVGTFHTLKQGKNYSTAILFDRKGGILGQYDKNKLIILGEYWPYSWHPSFYDYFKNNAVMENYAIFKPSNAYEAGSKKVLQIKYGDGAVSLGVLICLEGHYPGMLDYYKKSGAKFIINPVSNRWLATGGKQFSYLTSNLYDIESVQSGLPIISSGVNSFAGIFYPDGNKMIVSDNDEAGFKIVTEDVSF